MSSYLKPFFSHWLPVLLWAGQIFFFSSHSNPADFLPRFLVRFFWNTFIFEQRLFMLMGGVGHLVNYAVLAYLLARALVWKASIKPNALILVFLISFVYGISDEIHQIIVPMRTFQVRDILINGLGAMVGLAVYVSYRTYTTRVRKPEPLLL